MKMLTKIRADSCRRRAPASRFQPASRSDTLLLSIFTGPANIQQRLNLAWKSKDTALKCCLILVKIEVINDLLVSGSQDSCLLSLEEDLKCH